MRHRIHRIPPATALLLWSCLVAPAFGVSADSSFVGPRMPDPVTGAQQALQNFNACVPWSSGCGDPPPDARLDKNDGFVKSPPGQTWTKTPAGWVGCTETRCDRVPLTCPSLAPPCKAQEEREKREKTDKAFQANNDQEPDNAAGVPPSDEQPGDIAAIAGKILANQPPNSMLIPNGGAGAEATGTGDWNSFYETIQDMSGISVGEPPKKGAIKDAFEMREQALKAKSFDPSGGLDPGGKNSNLFDWKGSRQENYKD